MAWNSGLAYNASLCDAVRTQLEKWTVTDLAIAIANDKFARMFPSGWTEKRQRTFDRWISKYSALPIDILIDACMNRAIRTDTADNGGHFVWIDKDGCSRVDVRDTCVECNDAPWEVEYDGRHVCYGCRDMLAV